MKSLNTLTASQRAKHCGEIRHHFSTTATQIDDALRARVEASLRMDPGHQLSYYDLLLVTPEREELDFETNILTSKETTVDAILISRAARETSRGVK